MTIAGETIRKWFQPAASRVENLGGAESCNFPTGSRKLPTDGIIMAARSFNFASRFSQNGGGFRPTILHFFDEIFTDKKKIF